jgi:hypothetical protein
MLICHWKLTKMNYKGRVKLGNQKMARWSIISYNLKKKVVHCVINNHTIKNCYTFNKLYITSLPWQTFTSTTWLTMTSIVIAFQLATTLIMTTTQLVVIYTKIAIWFFAIQCNYIQLLQLNLCFIFKIAFQSTITMLPKLLWILKIKVCVLFLQTWRYKLHTL